MEAKSFNSKNLMTQEERLIFSNKIKEKLGFFSGLHWGKTNTGGICFSRHWPHIIPFSWTLWFEPQWMFKHDGVWVKCSWPRYFFKFTNYPKMNDNSQWVLEVFWLLRLSFHQQDQDWMISEHPRYANLLIPNAVRDELFFALGDENIGWPV